MDASLKLKTITTWILISRQGQVNFIPSLICYAHCTFQVLMETQRLPKWSINPESSALMLCLTTLWLVLEKTHTLYYYDSKMDCDIRPRTFPKFWFYYNCHLVTKEATRKRSEGIGCKWSNGIFWTGSVAKGEVSSSTKKIMQLYIRWRYDKFTLGSLQPQIRKERWNKIHHRPSEAWVLEESNARVNIKWALRWENG